MGRAGGRAGCFVHQQLMWDNGVHDENSHRIDHLSAQTDRKWYFLFAQNSFLLIHWKNVTWCSIRWVERSSSHAWPEANGLMCDLPSAHWGTNICPNHPASPACAKVYSHFKLLDVGFHKCPTVWRYFRCFWNVYCRWYFARQFADRISSTITKKQLVLSDVSRSLYTHTHNIKTYVMCVTCVSHVCVTCGKETQKSTEKKKSLNGSAAEWLTCPRRGLGIREE